MPNKMSEDKRRVTYAEWADIYDLVRQIAETERRDVSDVIRKATQKYVDAYPFLSESKPKPKR